MKKKPQKKTETPPTFACRDFSFLIGAQFKPEAIAAVMAVAESLKAEANASAERAKALHELARVFTCKTVEINAPITVQIPGNITVGQGVTLSYDEGQKK